MSWEALQRLTLPDPWQQEAITHLRDGKDVIVDAPTGAGKTFIFEKFLDNAKPSRQAVFTVPTRALANDKFAEWQAAGRDVGILTGDVAHRTSAPLLVGTLEAVQFLADTKGRAPSILVVDEYQWLGDSGRGNHYEGVVLALPKQSRLLLLSGSVGNPDDVGSWLQRLGREVRVIRQHDRPVPLDEVHLDALLNRVPRSVEGFWPRRITGALRDELGPILIFAPQRQDAVKLARLLARSLPPCQPLELTDSQRRNCTPALARILGDARVAWHHSGMAYSERAGLVEPLAKAGQLRVVVATLGLSSGINFSLRSVAVTTATYTIGGIPQQIEPHELLQMAGRAGRRGKDDRGFFLVTNQGPRLGGARPQRLKRSGPLPASILLRRLIANPDQVHEIADDFMQSLFLEDPPPTGIEATRHDNPQSLPCQQHTDTGRARLVRRRRRPFAGCKACPHRQACLQLDPSPTLLWQWQRAGLLDKQLQPTGRGHIAAAFLGAEGLALAAGLAQKHYSHQDLLYDCANLYGGERFCEDNPRWSGKLAIACQKTYGNFTIDGWLQGGVPPGYGFGAAEALHRLHDEGQRRGQLTTDHTGKGDLDRLVTEWTSLLRTIVQAEVFTPTNSWLKLQATAELLLEPLPDKSAPELPRLTQAQLRPIEHHRFKIY